MTVLFENSYLKIQELVPSDAEAMVDAVLASGPELSSRFPWAGTYNLHVAHQYIDAAIVSAAQGTAYTFAIFEKMTKNIIGTVSLRIVGNDALVGYWVRTSHHGFGIATIAARAIKAYAFDELKLPSLKLTIRPNNAGSIRVAEKIGAKNVGVEGDFINFHVENYKMTDKMIQYFNDDALLLAKEVDQDTLTSIINAHHYDKFRSEQLKKIKPGDKQLFFMLYSSNSTDKKANAKIVSVFLSELETMSISEFLGTPAKFYEMAANKLPKFILVPQTVTP